MPDLLASTSLLPLTQTIPSRAPVAVPAVADFMAMLGELVLPPGGKPQAGKGQALAGDGKNLPVDPATGEEGEVDPLVAWLPAGLVPLPPVEPAALPDVALVATSPAFETAEMPVPNAAPPLTLPGAAVPSTLTADAVASAAVVEMSPTTPAGIEPSVAASAPVETSVIEAVPVEGEAVTPRDLPAAPGAAPRGKAEAPVREMPIRPALAHAAVPQPVAPGATAVPTAAQVFAAAISASFDSSAAPAPRAADPVTMQAQAAATEQLRTTVQAMSGAEQPPLDLSRDDWASKMVDRIATLRDAAEAADTRIRLAPENLGNVDVSIRREGDRLHVHFAADNPATRQLLAEAAPRLAELADARGVKLGQTSVDGGAGGQQQGQPNQSQPNQPARPASAAAHTSQSDRDDRVA